MSTERFSQSNRTAIMLQIYLILALILSLFVLVACETERVPDELISADQPTVLPAPIPEIPNLLVDLNGEVEIRRLDWYEFEPAYLGAEMRPGDLIRVPDGGEAIILCGDRLDTTQDLVALLQPGENGLPCQLYRPGPRGELAPARGIPRLIPYVISPRDTRLLNPRPPLRWHPLADVFTYTVSLKGNQITLGPIEAENATLTFPYDWPSLQPGQTYRVVVEGGGRSSEEEQVGRSFVLVDTQEAARIHALRAELTQLPLEQTALDLSLVNLYIARGLYSEAIDLLEEIVAVSSEPAVYKLLGDSYLAIQLPHEAEKWYLRALELFEIREILEGQAEALVGLGLVYHTLGNTPTARLRWEEAKKCYEILGDRVGVSQISEWLEATKP